MDLILTLVILIFTGIVIGGFTSFVAHEKNRGEIVWFLLGFFFQLVALIAVVGVPSLPQKRKNSAAGVPPGADQEKAEDVQIKVAENGMCEDCKHFKATGIIDRYKGICHLHEKRTYKNHSCEDFSELK